MPGPLFAWGAPQVLNAAPWVMSNGTVTDSVGGLRNPFGEAANVYAVTNTGGVLGALDLTVTVADVDTVLVPICVRGNGSPQSALQMFNGGGAISASLQINIAGDGSVTTQQESSVGGATVRGTQVALGNGGTPGPSWYLVLAEFSGLPAGALTLRFYPRIGATTAGSTYVYWRTIWTHGYELDSAVAGPMARAGSAAMRAQSGVEDAWDAGTDEELRGSVRYIPPSMVADPPCSGYDGDGSGLVGVGFRALLRAGRRRDVIRYCRDRANTAEFVDGYLVEPYDSLSGSVETDGTVSVPIALRSDTPYRAYL